MDVVRDEPMSNSDAFEERYQRQLLLPEVGRAGQVSLASKHVLVVGAGGLGSTYLPLLAGAGLGKLTICDGDVITLSNLPRQILYTTEQIGHAKALLAAERLRANSPTCEVIPVVAMLMETNILALTQGVDLIIDATDNEATRRLIDRYAVEHSLPWLYASVEGWQGQVALFTAGSRSYHELFPEQEQECAEPSTPLPVLASTPAVVASLATAEALKYLLGLPTSLADELLLIDSLGMNFLRVKR